VKSIANITVKAGEKLDVDVDITGVNAGHLIIGIKSESAELGE